MADDKYSYGQQESSSQKFARKASESPFMILGMAGFVLAAGLGAYRYKHRDGMSTSLYLMQLRIIAQGTVVGSLCGGIVYSLVSELTKKNNKE